MQSCCKITCYKKQVISSIASSLYDHLVFYVDNAMNETCVLTWLWVDDDVQTWAGLLLKANNTNNTNKTTTTSAHYQQFPFHVMQ